MGVQAEEVRPASQFFVTVYYVSSDYDVATGTYVDSKVPAVGGQHGPFASDVEAREAASALAEQFLYGSAATLAGYNGGRYEVKVHRAERLSSST